MFRAVETIPRPLEDYREYLRMLAGLQLDARGRSVVDASDIAQQTLLKAHENLYGFRGNTEAELRAWLRAILVQQLALVARRRRGPGGRTKSLDADFLDCSPRFEALLACEQSSPSARVMHAERLVELAAAMARLPADQRVALELRYLRGLSVSAVASEMGRTLVSVTGLLYRGTKALRDVMADSP
jgi:RNA polymerase sigma-70 factor (ECF subfamily)